MTGLSFVTRFSTFIVMAVVLGACSNERMADEQWEHSNLSSYAAAFSQDGRYVLVGDTDAPARLWDIEANKIVYSWQNLPEEAGTTTLVGFSTDTKVAATVERDTVVLWNMANGDPMRRLDFPVNIKAIALSQDGSSILLALADRTAIYFDVVENRVMQVFEHDGVSVGSPINQPINAVAISPSGKYALTGGDDNTARLWSLQTGKQLRIWKHENHVNLVSFYPKGGYVITGAGNGNTYLRNMVSGKTKYRLPVSSWPDGWALPDIPSFQSTTSALSFSPDGKYMVTGHPSQKICLWTVATGKKISCWQVARRQALRPGVVIQAVSFSADGKSVYSEAGNGIGQKFRIR